MNKLISTNQLSYSVSAFILASVLLTSNLYRFAKNDSWASVILGFAASLLIISIYISLSRRYPGLGLFDINNAVFGKAAGKAVSALYLFFFLSLAFFNTRDLGDFIKSSVLRQTPLMVIFVMFIIICAWAVRKGPVNMTRYGFMTTALSATVIIIITLFLVDKIELNNLLPAFTLPIKYYLIGGHLVAMLPFCEILVFAMLIPYMRRPHQFGHAMRKGLTIAAFVLLLIVLRDLVVLGQYASIYTLPTYQAARYIDIGDILTRVEIIYAVVLINTMFYKVSILYYVCVSGLAQVFNIEDNKPFVYVIGALICVYASASFEHFVEHVKWNMTVAATYGMVFLLFLPFITLLVSIIRKRVSPSASVPKIQ